LQQSIWWSKMHQNNSEDTNHMDEINLIDYLNVIIKHRLMIIRNFFIVVIIVIIISLLLPAKYTAVSTLMPPQDQDRFSMSSLLTDVNIPGISLPTNTSPSDLMVEIIRSRTVNERVLNRFFRFKNDSLKLFKILKYDSVELALLHVENFASFGANEQGIISVEVELKDRNLSADVANTYVEELDRVNQEKSVSRAKNSRVYIESQLMETEGKLQQSANELANFQKENKAISLEAQLVTSIQQVGELKGKIIAKEVQLGVLLQTMKPENPIVTQTQTEINELQKLYQELQFGTLNKKNQNEEFYLPFTEIPAVGLKLATLMREVKVHETVWKLLNQQYYQAKIEEARNTPTVQMLDRATPPVKRSSPKRKLLVISFGLIALFLSVLGAFGEEYIQKLNTHPEDKQKIERILSDIRQDYNKLKAKFKKKN